MTTRQKAREICAKLIPHTTSVHNVDVVAKALDDARREALSGRVMKTINTCLLLRKKELMSRKGHESDKRITEIDNAIRALMEAE